ncbi:MAG: hypothetical protein U0746_05655 [Gemmataceae bacterium]
MRYAGNFTRAAALGMVGSAALGFWLGHGGPLSTALAAPPPAAPPPAAAAPASDYSQRVVAYVNGNVPITREDLGEYLIARHGVDKIELFVNKKIIDFAAQKQGIDVTAAEIEAAIDRDLGAMGNIKRGDFINRVLKQYGKTLYEWKEDVIRPRLIMEKMVKPTIKVSDDDLQKMFQAQYGPKVECRIIIWPKGEEKIALNSYDKLRSSEEEFNRAACSQAVGHLAAVGGRIQPVARFSGVHPEVEQQAFTLKPGDVSRLIVTPEGTVCIKVDRQVPADDKVKLEGQLRQDLEKLCFDKKVTEEIPLVMKRLRDEAKPVFILKKPATAQELEEEVKTELQQTGGIKK